MNLAQLTELPGFSAWPSPVDGIPMQTHAWTQARMGLIPLTMPRHLFAVTAEQQVRALAPLFATGGWLREPPNMFEPSDLIADDSESLNELARGLARQSMPLYLERLPANSPTVSALRRAYARRGMVLARPAMPTPVIHLSDQAREVDAWFNAGRRSDFRRYQRLAGNFGPVSYEIHAPSDETQLETLLNEAYAMEARSWKAMVGTALTSDFIQGEFFRRFSRDAAIEGMLRIAFLRVDGQAIAMQIACEWRRRFWLLKISHDRAFNRCSPGQLLIRHTLRHAAESGLQSYEFMGIMDDWTRQWTRDARQYIQLRAIPFGAASLKMLIKRGARAVFKR